MHPAFSVIFLTTLIGAGQGLFLALFVQQAAAWLALSNDVSHTDFHLIGALLSLMLLSAGLFASLFHLGHPERGWRSAARWRTSWLSREVIALPACMLAVGAYAAVWYLRPGGEPLTVLNWAFWVGSVSAVLCLCLFLCTGMIYACIRFLQEWASPLTIINFILMGSASGWLIATALAVELAPSVVPFLAYITLGLTLAALAFRIVSLIRNARLIPKCTLQTAIGIRHDKIVQTSQGAMGGSFNTREFFHGRRLSTLGMVRVLFLTCSFLLPLLLVWAALGLASFELLLWAVLIQYFGLVLERWYFFADAKHPQNLYYQAA